MRLNRTGNSKIELKRVKQFERNAKRIFKKEKQSNKIDTPNERDSDESGNIRSQSRFIGLGGHW